VCLYNRTTKTTDKPTDEEEHRTDNSTYKKLAVQWLNEALCFVSSSVLVDSFVLRNRQLLVAANRCSKSKSQLETVSGLEKNECSGYLIQFIGLTHNIVIKNIAGKRVQKQIT
jgi:hypothetical protein